MISTGGGSAGVGVTSIAAASLPLGFGSPPKTICMLNAGAFGLRGSIGFEVSELGESAECVVDLPERRVGTHRAQEDHVGEFFRLEAAVEHEVEAGFLDFSPCFGDFLLERLPVLQ
jgi:hypothetical protein